MDPEQKLAIVRRLLGAAILCALSAFVGYEVGFGAGQQAQIAKTANTPIWRR